METWTDLTKKIQHTSYKRDGLGWQFGVFFWGWVLLPKSFSGEIIGVKVFGVYIISKMYQSYTNNVYLQ